MALAKKDILSLLFVIEFHLHLFAFENIWTCLKHLEGYVVN